MKTIMTLLALALLVLTACATPEVTSETTEANVQLQAPDVSKAMEQAEEQQVVYATMQVIDGNIFPETFTIPVGSKVVLSAVAKDPVVMELRGFDRQVDRFGSTEFTFDATTPGTYQIHCLTCKADSGYGSDSDDEDQVESFAVLRVV